MSAKLRMTLYFTLMVLLLSILVLLSIISMNRSVLSDDPGGRLVNVVMKNADDVEFDNGKFDWDDLHTYRQGVYCCIYTSDGKLLMGAQRENWKIDLPFESNVIRTVAVGGEQILVYDTLVDMSVADLWIRGMVSSESHEGLTHTLIVVSIILLPIILLFSVGGGWLIAWLTFRPMERTIDAANSIHDANDLSARLDIHHGSSEMRRLGKAFDRMFSRLERVFERERQFTSDASHELRTPITVILAQCDRSRRKDVTREDFLNSIAVIEEQCGKMSSLVNSLLSLSRMQLGTDRYPMRQGNLSELVDNCCDSFLPDHDRQIRFEKEIAPGIQTRYNAELVSRAVQNLLQNAYKYGQDGGFVQLCLALEEKHAVLSVQDNGIGIEQENLEKVWQRFWQADPSRSEDGGMGLGLAMVQEIMQIHGGIAAVESSPGRGSTFILKFPIK